MQNIPIIGKFLALMGLFALFSLGTALYSGDRIIRTDDAYSDMLKNESRAATELARANRAFQAARAAAGTLMIVNTAEATKTAADNLKQAHDEFVLHADNALAASESDTIISKLKADGLTVLDQTCANAFTRGAQARGSQDRISAQAAYLRECEPNFPPLSKALTEGTNTLLANVDRRSDELTATSIATYWTTLGLVIGGTLVVVLIGFFAIRAWLIRPITTLSGVMTTLASGDLTAPVDGTARRDEVGGMARAVQIFKDNGLKARDLESEAERQRSLSDQERLTREEEDRRRAQAMAEATSGLASGLKHLASGDLAFQLTDRFAEEFESLRADFNQAVDQLRTTLASVADATGSIDGGSREISRSADDLSKRTEQQAASLEETAAALDEITANVANSSKRAEEAR
ncbi:HAMP domain-containing protein, partial [Rhizobium sp. YIM 134829]|uniref:HAMP domain-containing protein n=1 Tax=Rhizobium sp. YIM 134829 TaxID=3390453 RepID=UPI00397DC853